VTATSWWLDGFSKGTGGTQRHQARRLLTKPRGLQGWADEEASTGADDLRRQALPFPDDRTSTPDGGRRQTDAHGLAKLVNGAFGKSFTTFRNESMIQLNLYKWVPRKDGYEQARKLLTPSVRFAIEDVWDGPPMNGRAAAGGADD